MGECPGPGIWDAGTLPDIPARVRNGSQIVWAGRVIHQTHRVVWKQGLIICLKCGSLSHGTRVNNLVDECLGCPGSAFTARNLRNFRMGRHPYGEGRRWPAGRRDPVPDIFQD